MRAPRLTVGVFADDTDEVDLGVMLSGVDHHVEHFDDVADAHRFELVVISVRDDRLEDVVEAMSARARVGQIFLHTSLGYGVQVFDSLETSGAMVCAAYPLTEKLWVVAAADELGETIVELLVGELGGQALAVPDTQRLRLAAALTQLSFVATVRNDAHTLLTEALGNEEKSLEIVGGAGEDGVVNGPVPLTSPAGLGGERALPLVEGATGIAAQTRAIENPGAARAFRELARRAAQQTGAHDVELWAMGQD